MENKNSPLDGDIEERADQLTEEEIMSGTAKSQFFDLVHEALTSRGTKLIEGPRGSGKTHLMRYTWIECKRDQKLPLCLYVSFNKYLRLEPYLGSNSDALGLFHSWVLARILIAVSDLFEDMQDSDKKIGNYTFREICGYEKIELVRFVGSLENRNPAVYLESEIELSIDKVIHIINRTSQLLKRKRAVILLDDAALTLTPEYMREFFDIVRVLKSATISPKASVYPGTTEYGSRFHVNHEAETVSVWLDVKSKNYKKIMGEIAQNRIAFLDDIPSEYVELLKYAAFGIPRAFIVMLREFSRGNFSTPQQGINQIIQNHNNWRDSEYRSFAMKIPEFKTLIETGERFLNEAVSNLKKANMDLKDSDERQIVIGIQKFENPLAKRMINLLVEAGMLFEHTSVSHGDDRTYQRYTPHFSKLIQEKVFSSGSRGFSATKIVEFISRKDSKHPSRTNIEKILGAGSLDQLKLDLPPCTNCNAIRLSDDQKFCHRCGAELVDPSTFERCMAIKLSDIPTMTAWQRTKISQIQARTIGDFLSLQDPGTELRKLNRIGPKIAGKMIGGIDQFVDEFLS